MKRREQSSLSYVVARPMKRLTEVGLDGRSC